MPLMPEIWEPEWSKDVMSQSSAASLNIEMSRQFRWERDLESRCS